MTKKWDLVVVGAGIVGITIAWMAKKFYNKNVLLVEQALANRGATAYALALRTPYYETIEMQRLTSKSKRLYESYIDVLNTGCSMDVPSFWIVPESEAEGLQSKLDSNSLKLASSSKINELSKFVPNLTIRKDEVLMYDPKDKIGSPTLTSELLLREFISLGGKFVEGVQYMGSFASMLGVNVRFFDGSETLTKHAVLATGPWMSSNFSRHPSRLVRTKKIVAFHIELTVGMGAPIVQWSEIDAFFAPDHSRNRYLISVCSDDWDVLPSGEGLSITEADRTKVTELLSEYIPCLIEKVEGGRVFCDGYASSGEPYIASDPNTSGLYYAGACGGAGYRLAPAIADEVMIMLEDGSLLKDDQ